MKITLDAAKAIYRSAIDMRASDGEGAAWWNEVLDDVRDVIAAGSASAAAAVIEWWHNDWSAVSDTPRETAKRIRQTARVLRVNA